MAIRISYTDPQTGEVSPEAHLIVHNPVLRPETRQVVVRASVYASKADYDAGKEPIRELNRTLGATQYANLRTENLNYLEPRMITQFFPTGTRVAD